MGAYEAGCLLAVVLALPDRDLVPGAGVISSELGSCLGIVLTFGEAGVDLALRPCRFELSEASETVDLERFSGSRPAVLGGVAYLAGAGATVGPVAGSSVPSRYHRRHTHRSCHSRSWAAPGGRACRADQRSTASAPCDPCARPSDSSGGQCRAAVHRLVEKGWTGPARRRRHSSECCTQPSASASTRRRPIRSWNAAMSWKTPGCGRTAGRRNAGWAGQSRRAHRAG